MTELCQSLKAEHRVIERVLNALAAEAVRIEQNDQPNTALIEKAIVFIREFADGVHHQKEEQVLFPRMEKAGIPRDGGPIGVMLDEHEMGRRYVGEIEQSLKSNDHPSLAQAIRGYVTLLNDHIQKEDNVLFPMADEVFADDQKQQITADFDQAEKTQASVTKRQRAWVESLG